MLFYEDVNWLLLPFCFPFKLPGIRSSSSNRDEKRVVCGIDRARTRPNHLRLRGARNDGRAPNLRACRALLAVPCPSFRFALAIESKTTRPFRRSQADRRRKLDPTRPSKDIPVRAVYICTTRSAFRATERLLVVSYILQLSRCVRVVLCCALSSVHLLFSHCSKNIYKTR